MKYLIMRLRHVPPFDWKFLKIGTLRAKDLRKNILVVKKVGFILAKPRTPVIRVVLLHTDRFVQFSN